MRSRVMPWLETGMTAGSWWLADAFLPPKTREMNLRITGCRSGRGLRCGKARILPQRDDLPAHFASVGAQRGVGVDRDRRAHALHQRQVVVRIAVEGAVGETA